MQNTTDIHEQLHYVPDDANQAQQTEQGPISSEFTLMTPTDYPQVFPLSDATTMLPFNHPQIFPLSDTTAMLPFNHPQIFPLSDTTTMLPFHHPQFFLPEPAYMFSMNPQDFPFENSANMPSNVPPQEYLGQGTGVAGHSMNAQLFSAVAV
jgi:hypothetical protein